VFNVCHITHRPTVTPEQQCQEDFQQRQRV